MSSVLNPEPSTRFEGVSPGTPWAVPVAKRKKDWTIIGVCAVVAAAIVLVTGVAGPDGWALMFFVSMMVATLIRARNEEAKKRKDGVMSLVIKSLAVLAFVPWLSIFFSLLQKGYQALYFGYFLNDMRVTGPDDELNSGGIAHAIVGSVLMVLVATLVTLPLGIMTGAYLTEIRGRLSFFVRFIIQSMAGVPSIVAGLFVYSTLVLQVKSFSGLAGSAALAVLMLPTVARTAEEVLKLVPDELRNAGYALGSRQWRTAVMIVIPTVRSGLVTAGILGIARIIGETAPLLLTASFTSQLRVNIFTEPMAALPTYIFDGLKVGTEYAVARAWGASVVLMLIVGGLFMVARILGNRGPRA